jgi:outer membrane protein insertion porin family
MIISVEAQTQRADSLVVVRASGLNPGDPLTASDLQSAIRRIYATGLFSRITADTYRIADGVRVVLRVTEFARLKAKGVHFIGNHKITTKDLNKRLAAKDKELLTEARIFEWTQQVSDLYKDKGFILSKVQSQQTPPDARGEAEMNFFIEEGENIRIRSIRINGAKAVPEGKVLAKMANKKACWPLRRGLYKDDEFKKDLDRIIDFYKEKGLLDAKVLDYDLRHEAGWANITINVSEGIKYYYGGLSLAGESVLTQQQLEPVLRMKTGQVYNQKRVNLALSELSAQYAEQGYIYTSIQPVDSIRRDTVDIRFRIAENQPARIRLVNIEGNDRTHEKVIRREVVSMPGSVFKRSEVIRSQQNVFNLGFFEDIQLDYKRVSDTSPDIDLTYGVKEKFAGSIGAGVSYSATEGIVGYVELTQPNLFGRSEQLHAKVEKGGSKFNVELGFTEPWLFDTPTAAGASIFYTTQTYDNYDRRDRGFEINSSRPLALDYSRGYATLHIGDVTLSKIRGNQIYSGDTFPKTTISTTFRLDRDSRDYVFNPSSGSYLSYALELAGGTVLGDVHYHRHTLESNLYYPMFWKFVLRFRNHLGLVSGYRTGDTVPPYERFYPGGTGEDGLRGYPDRSLPAVVGSNPGGKTEALFSLEYRLKLSRGLTILTFADAGNAWESIREINLSDLKRGAGVGVRLEIPMLGWLGLDLGYGFDRPSGSKFEPHFQIGSGFGSLGF